MPKLKKPNPKVGNRHYESVRYLGLSLQEVFAQENFDPLVELIRACKGRITAKDKDGNTVLDADHRPIMEPLLPPRDYVMALKALCEFSIPKLRTQEVRGDGDDKVIVELITFADPNERRRSMSIHSEEPKQLESANV